MCFLGKQSLFFIIACCVFSVTQISKAEPLKNFGNIPLTYECIVMTSDSLEIKIDSSENKYVTLAPTAGSASLWSGPDRLDINDDACQDNDADGYSGNLAILRSTCSNISPGTAITFSDTMHSISIHETYHKQEACSVVRAQLIQTVPPEQKPGMYSILLTISDVSA